LGHHKKKGRGRWKWILQCRQEGTKVRVVRNSRKRKKTYYSMFRRDSACDGPYLVGVFGARRVCTMRTMESAVVKTGLYTRGGKASRSSKFCDVSWLARGGEQNLFTKSRDCEPGVDALMARDTHQGTRFYPVLVQVFPLRTHPFETQRGSGSIPMSTNYPRKHRNV
jgi:hypothetical protein